MSDDKKKETPVKEAPAPKPVHEQHAHGKKISSMDLAEINVAIEKCEKQMGGLWSHYGQSLVGHRKALLAQGSAPKTFKKAA